MIPAPKPRLRSRKPPTLAAQLDSAQSQQRVWRDLSALPDVIYHGYCGAAFTYVENDPHATLKLVAWLRTHARCGYKACHVTEKAHEAERNTR